jgi:purine-nucleoside phosphorylase
MATPHNTAEKGDIAKVVLLPGDPLRAKFIAENFLEQVNEFNRVRNNFGYTGLYKGKPVSVMGTGMGCASIGIYSYELIHFYGVTTLIRIGSCGGLAEGIKVGDLVMAMGASTDTNYAGQYRLSGTFSAIASYRLLSGAVQAAEKNSLPYQVGNVFCTDVFYRPEDALDSWRGMGITAVEMESYALYCNAARGGADALAILTVSDLLSRGGARKGPGMTPEEREQGLKGMMTVALDTAHGFCET